jgi:chromosome partitioning protein
MRTIAFVTQKGGAGKSTLASSIAVAARRAGERVFIIDLDPLQSLVKWSQARETTDVPVEHVPPTKLTKALSALEKRGVTLVVIDAPGADSDNSDAAIRAADLCIIPARPNAFDLWASELTRASIKDKKKDYAFLLNQCPPAQQSARVELGAKALQSMGVLLSPLVTSRVDYQEAARLGLGVSELNPDGAAAREMRELWAAIKRRLKKNGAVAKAARAEPETKPNVKASTRAGTAAQADAPTAEPTALEAAANQADPNAPAAEAGAKASKLTPKPSVRKAA